MLSMNIQPATPKNIELAAVLIRDGKLVALPTETVYGLAADATNDKAVAEIYALKGRPQFNPLIIHVADIAMAKHEVEWNEKAEALARKFWPGALTLVLPRAQTSRVSLLASAGGDTLAVRCPAHEAAQAVIRAAGVPLAAPSANRSGRVSPTTVQHVHGEFGDGLALILDGGACGIGVESTVIDLTGKEPLLLRPGGITKEAIEEALHDILSLQAEGKGGGILKSPGMLESHYAPSTPVRLNVTAPRADEALLAFGPHVPSGAKCVINLSVAGDDREAAARLFAAMRELDSPEFSAIAVMPIPEAGLGAAINDRLRRAAAGR